MPESRKRPAPLPDDFSKVFGSTRTSADPVGAAAPARPVQAGPLCPYCRGSLGEPHTVSSRPNRASRTDGAEGAEGAEILLLYCTRCGCTLGILRDGDGY